MDFTYQPDIDAKFRKNCLDFDRHLFYQSDRESHFGNVNRLAKAISTLSTQFERVSKRVKRGADTMSPKIIRLREDAQLLVNACSSNAASHCDQRVRNAYNEAMRANGMVRGFIPDKGRVLILDRDIYRRVGGRFYEPREETPIPPSRPRSASSFRPMAGAGTGAVEAELSTETYSDEIRALCSRYNIRIRRWIYQIYNRLLAQNGMHTDALNIGGEGATVIVRRDFFEKAMEYFRSGIPTTALCFDQIDELNRRNGVNMRRLIFMHYNSLLELNGVEEGGDLDVSCTTRKAVIYRPDLFVEAYKAYRRVSTTAEDFLEIDRLNRKKKTNVRKAIYLRYNALMRAAGVREGEIDPESLSQEIKIFCMVRFRQAIEENRFGSTMSSAYEGYTTLDYFERIHALNIKRGANLRREIHIKYNQLLKASGDHSRGIDIESSSKAIPIARHDLFEMALEKAEAGRL